MGGLLVLRDLNELANTSRENYHNTFINEDFKLSRVFKERLSHVLGTRNTSIQFFDYSAEITTSSSNKIFCPNQWFYIATFVVEFVSELIRYRSILESIADREVAGMSRRQFFEKIKNLKDADIDEDAPEIKVAIVEYFEEDLDSAENLCRFIKDYSWWYGSKTIDRKDYYVSPTLHLLGLVNASQSYVAEIAYFLASDEELMEYAINMKNQEFMNPNGTLGENLIVYGAPGTGKSKYLEDNFTNITRVVFHSDYSYFDFVGSYKPTPLYKRSNTNLYSITGDEFSIGEPIIDYQFIPGPFINVLINAVRNTGTKYTILIEELNRANAPSVFGDIFQLLDRKVDGSSQYKIQPNEDLMRYLMSLEDINHHFIDGLFIPSNMNIVATMNSADQGVFVLDSAFKRRWKFKYMSIIESGFVHENSLITYAGEEFKWSYLLSSINTKLKVLGINEDRLIGQYFITPEEIDDSSSLASKLLIYLWDDVVRYKRQEFFKSDVRTYSELVTGFTTGEDVMNIREYLEELVERNEAERNMMEEEQVDEQVEELLEE
ncbi:AAA family ATPase [Sutcliffiella sp. NC1]|uniref:AAA family ATPase n=1 Tax=Sutcliffiella sp. NC1 TaxID=3004096 RepID=UPI0022DDE83E|nr:AAA family ATPase [Sutcliffiella sp. NC1]WBL15116.1 AAA family ATPase [Sutcliffiella sp. NC1]